MARSLPPVYPATERILSQLGARIKAARLRRGISAVDFAQRVGVARATLSRMEAGDSNVFIGTFARALAVLGLDLDLNLIAKDDPVGRQLQDAASTIKRRRSRDEG